MIPSSDFQPTAGKPGEPMPRVAENQSRRDAEAALDSYHRKDLPETPPVPPPQEQAAAGQPEPMSAGLISKTALANALFIAVVAVISVVVFWAATQEGAIFEFSPAERAQDMALWIPSLEVMAISLLVAMVWSWMFRIWPFIANLAACFLCLWGYQTLAFYLGVPPVVSGLVACLVVTVIFWLVAYVRTSREEIPARVGEPAPVVEAQVSPMDAVTVEAAPVEVATPAEVVIPAAEAQPLVVEAAPSPLEVPEPAWEPAVTAPPPAATPPRSHRNRFALIALVLLIVLAVMIAISIFQGAGDRLPAAGSGQPGGVRSGCRLWNEISAADVGQEVCVTGVVERTYLGGELTYLRFSDDPDAFRLVNVNGVDFSAVVGQCVVAEGVVEVYGQMPYIEIGDRLDHCDR